MSELTIQSFDALTDDVLDTLMQLERRIFEVPFGRDVLIQELSTRPHLLVLIAYWENEPCGYKIGFEYHSDHEYFYSWNGGVVPEKRRHGIARALMDRQHAVARQKGYRFIRTQTKNRYRSMLLLNIQSGFDITGVYKKIRETEHGIILEKAL